MGSTIIEIQPLRPPAVIILKDIVGINPDLEFVRTVGTGGPVKFFLTV